MDDAFDAERPTYPTHHWGALAADPWMEIAGPAANEAFYDAALRAWVAGGGAPEVYEALCKPVAIRS